MVVWRSIGQRFFCEGILLLPMLTTRIVCLFMAIFREVVLVMSLIVLSINICKSSVRVIVLMTYWAPMMALLLVLKMMSLVVMSVMIVLLMFGHLHAIPLMTSTISVGEDVVPLKATVVVHVVARVIGILIHRRSGRRWSVCIERSATVRRCRPIYVPVVVMLVLSWIEILAGSRLVKPE